MDGDRTPATAPHANRWQARPVAALALRAASTVVPLLVGVLVARAAVGAAPALPGGRALAALLGVGTALAGRRAARPVVALATLLRLGLAFPGPAPHRAALALQRPRTVVRRARTSRTGTAADNAAALAALLAVVGAHDRRHRHHTRRVVALCALLADRLGLPAPDRDRLAWAALLHDVGALAVDDDILDKAGRPTPAQWQVLRRHPEDGARLAAPLVPWLGPWGAAVRNHHERWDGTGYPDGLGGGAIPLAARVVGLADAYESMTAARPYRAPLATRAARAEVVRCRGSQFDPDVVDALLAVPVPRLLRATGLVSLLANLPMLGTLAMIGRQGVAAAAVPQAAAVAASTAVVLGGVAVTGGLVAPGPGGTTVAADGPRPA
ncbi:HD-GYP domain-containing protein, partial [Kineosporia sp. R_H_3]|uniref:HD-GYP domain-containing protein n=1 Tax=Kineosporia sp. R_H_3 TaxID=1961848 RepID=UPI000B4A68A5